MSLYDDDDDIGSDKKSDNTVAGWASGIKFMNQKTQMQIKKPLPQPKREIRRQHLAPVVAFRAKSNVALTTPKIISSSSSESRTEGSETLITTTPTTATSISSFILPYSVTTVSKKARGGGLKSAFSSCSFIAVDPEWQFDNEYDPYFPNEYEKALKELRERRDREAEEEEVKRLQGIVDGVEREDEELIEKEEKTGGVAIAPPASLNIDYDDDQPFSMSDIGKSSSFGKTGERTFGLGMGSVAPGSGTSAAAKIMAKYGYKEGQGLGRMEQGMSTALQVEKTSHKIGRIIHEKDIPKEGVVSLVGSQNLAVSYMDDDEFEMEPPPQASEPVAAPDIDELLKSQQDQEAEEQLENPSKVVLLSNMVGPAEVDDDLEPEVKEECQKYGEVVAVIVFKMPDVDSEDSIRIFVEFTQVTSAVKAFMDLNGRFFGGRQVRAKFYDPEKFNNLELTC